MRLKALCYILLIFTLTTTSCADPKTAVIKFSQELAPLEISLHELNTWWNVYIASERVRYYEAPLLVSRIQHYESQLQGLNTKLMQIQAPAELAQVRSIALEVGLEYIYIGNVPGHPANNTFCPRCGEKLVGRMGLTVTENNLQQGRCPFCASQIPGIWE